MANDLTLKLLGNVLLLLYLRLMQIIMIAILIIICCPLFLVAYGLCGKRNKRAADQEVIKNLNLIPIEDYKLYRQGLHHHTNRDDSEIEQEQLVTRLLSRTESTISDDSESLMVEGDGELTCAICLEGFPDGCLVVLLPCKAHTFH